MIPVLPAFGIGVLVGILLGHFAVDSVQTGISPSYYESVHNMLYSILIIFILMFCIYIYIIIYLYIWFTYTRNIKKHMAFSLHGPLLGVRWVRLSHQSFEWPLLIPGANNSLLCPNCSDLHKRLLGCDRKPGCSGSLQQKRASSAPSGSERILTLFINSYAPWVRRSVPSHIS